MVEGARLEIVLPSTGYQGSNPCLSANERTSNAIALEVLSLAEQLHHLNPRISGTSCRDMHGLRRMPERLATPVGANMGS